MANLQKRKEKGQSRSQVLSSGTIVDDLYLKLDSSCAY